MMNNFKLVLFFGILAVTLTCCVSKNSTTKKNYIGKNTGQKLSYSSVVLYTIDSSIYKELDTIWYFPDGKQAYKFFLGGGSFIDSSGKPIHERYKKYFLTDEQNESLKDSFLYKFCDNLAHACTPMYRDVFVFYDSSGKVVEQAQICFGCGDAVIYPIRDFMCMEESDLDFRVLQRFITSIKK